MSKVLKFKRSVFIAVYYLQGGMKAVIWTDVFQSVVIFLGLIVVVIWVRIKINLKLKGMLVLW